MFQEKISKLGKRLFRVFSLFGSLSVGTFSYFLYLSNKAKDEFELKKTENREINESVKNSLKAGDLLFLKHECSKSFSPTHIVKCFTHKFYKRRVIKKNQVDLYRQSEFDSIGIVVFTGKETRVISFFYDEFIDFSLDEFCALPYYQEIKASLLKTSLENYESKIEDFRVQAHHVKNVLNHSWPIRTSGLFRDSVDVLINLWVKIGFTKAEMFKNYLRQTVGDIEKANENYFSKGVCSFSPMLELKTAIIQNTSEN
jgi:hypothetical protein